MQIISNDIFFTFGMEYVASFLIDAKSCGVTVFDSGRQHVYFFNARQMRNNKIDDPFSALVYCHNLNVSRNASVNTMLYFLEKSDGSFGSLSLLTKREESVLRFLCEGSSVKTLLERYSITMKTFSMHKRNGLRKLGIKNTVMFYSLLQAWSEKWSVIFPETTGDGFKCDQRGEGTVLPNV